MKTAIFSLIIALSVAILSVLQFDRYQKFTLDTQLHLKEIQNDIAAKLEKFNHSLQQVEGEARSAFTKPQAPTWKLAEVEYFFTLASAQLALGEIKKAIEFFKSAQEKINLVNDQTLEPVSQALNTDLAALQNVSVPNTEALWLKISHLIEQTTNLNPQGVIGSEDKEIIAPKGIEQATSWQQTFLKGLHDLKDLIRIRHSTKPIAPLLTETQQTLIKTTLRILLEQIRSALLTKNQAIYQQAIEDTKQFLISYYDDSNPYVKTLLNDLTEFSKINVNPTLPPITSIPLFNKMR